MRVYLGACVCMLVSACDMTHSCVMLHLRERFLWQSVYVCVCVCVCVSVRVSVCVCLCVYVCVAYLACVLQAKMYVYIHLFLQKSHHLWDSFAENDV